MGFFKSFFEFVTPHKRYQPHIDGLRALAVMAVVFFHYAPSYFQGGFIGVDIFFVISGYLITGILQHSFNKTTFWPALILFYQRRIRRIFPAALVVLTLLLGFGWQVLFPFELKNIAAHILASTTFVENFLLWSESGYFDSDGIKKPLLHFWSLAVEEQFYIFWPIIIWYLIYKKLPLLKSISIMIVAAFVLSMFNTFLAPSSAFFLPFARLWELMIGAWLAIAQTSNLKWLDKGRILQSWAGLLLILAGFVFISPNHAFPGYWALFPVIGTALVINSGHTGFLNTRVACWKPVIWIGLISYPLYLWHWVLISFAVLVFEMRVPGISWNMAKGLMFVMSIVLAWLTYLWLETPVRIKGGNKTTVLLLSLMAALGLTALTVFLKDGVPERGYSLVNDTPAASAYLSSLGRSDKEDDCFNLHHAMSVGGKTALPDKFYCELGDSDADRLIVAYGDSHSLSMIPVLDRFGSEHGYKVAYAGIDSCLPVMGITRTFNNKAACDELADRMPAFAQAQKARAAVFIEAWPAYPEQVRMRDGNAGIEAGLPAFVAGLNDTAEFYAGQGTKVVFVEDNPEQEMTPPVDKIRFSNDLNDATINELSLARADYVKAQKGVNDALATVASGNDNAYVISNTDALCDTETCPLARSGQFLYYDSDHLSSFGALQTYDSMAEQLLKVLEE